MKALPDKGRWFEKLSRTDVVDLGTGRIWTYWAVNIQNFGSFLEQTFFLKKKRCSLHAIEELLKYQVIFSCLVLGPRSKLEIWIRNVL